MSDRPQENQESNLDTSQHLRPDMAKESKVFKMAANSDSLALSNLEITSNTRAFMPTSVWKDHIAEHIAPANTGQEVLQEAAARLLLRQTLA